MTRRIHFDRRPPLLRRRRSAVSGLLLLLLAACGGDEPTETAAPPPAQVAGSGLAAYDADGDGYVYQDAMHPEVVRDEPGLCPVCGMALTRVPVGRTGAGVVEIDPVTLQNMGVRTAVVTEETLERTLRTTGTVEASDAAREVVTLKVGGWVEELFVNVEGQHVRRGQPLLALYSPDLVATQQEYLLALRNRQLLGGGPDADRLVEAARTRLRLYDVSAEQVARLESTGEVQRTLTLYSPASGTVVEKQVVEGMQASPGQPLMEIVNLGSVWVQTAVPEHELGWVRPGVRAEIVLPSEPGVTLTGRVDYVYDVLDPALRTGTARVTVGNPGGRLKPGMYATVTLYGPLAEATPVVPADAVIRTGTEAVVIVTEGEGRFRPQPVVLGEEAGGVVQILEGVVAGDRVVTSAQFLIDSEARLAAAVGAMAAPGHEDHEALPPTQPAE
jgi:RND family efflux transporter MFP subunit